MPTRNVLVSLTLLDRLLRLNFKAGVIMLGDQEVYLTGFKLLYSILVNLENTSVSKIPLKSLMKVEIYNNFDGISVDHCYLLKLRFSFKVSVSPSPITETG